MLFLSRQGLQVVLRWGRWQRCHSNNNDDKDGDGDDQDLTVLSFDVDGGEVFIGDYGDNDGGQNQSQDLFVTSIDGGGDDDDV